MERNSTNGKVKPAKLLIKHGEKIDQAFEKAVEDALQKHLREGNTVAVWRNEKIQIVTPEEVLATKE